MPTLKVSGETAYAAWKAARQQQRTPRAYLVYLEGLKLQVNSDTSPLVETISGDILREKFRSTLWKELQDVPTRRLFVTALFGLFCSMLIE